MFGWLRRKPSVQEQAAEWLRHATPDELRDVATVQFVAIEGGGQPPAAALAWAAMARFQASKGTGADQERGRLIITAAWAKLESDPALRAKYQARVADAGALAAR